MEDNAVEPVIPEYKRLAAECADTLKESRRIVEGTEFVGFNRADFRSRGKRSERAGAKKWHGRTKGITHQLVTDRNSRLAIAANKDTVRPLKPDYPMPMAPGVRAELYGDNPTPAQRRRFRKKTHRMFRNAA